MAYYITEDHCRLYYEERGPKDGKNVVFIHGGGCNRFFYTPFLRWRLLTLN